MPYTSPATVTAAEFITAARMNSDWVENIRALANPPSCRVYNTAAITLGTSGVATLLTFNAERYDTDGLHSTSTNTSRLTVPAGWAGIWDIFATIEISGSATGLRQIYFRVNGATAVAAVTTNAVTGVGTQLSLSTHYKLAVGDYVEVMARQDSGGSLTVSVGANYSPEFGMTWRGVG